RIYCSPEKVEPRDDIAAAGFDKYDVMEAPVIDRPEECFFHSNDATKNGFAMVHNEKLGLALVIRYDANVFKQLVEWKCMRAGDYALGLEPTTCGVMGRAWAREHGVLTTLEGGQDMELDFSIEVLEDIDEINAIIAMANKGTRK
ncbi:MAG: DUF4432 family protein, partial [Clostridia bacterium]|nr:DUF4432 family protein [Clostridia bacterium]